MLILQQFVLVWRFSKIKKKIVSQNLNFPFLYCAIWLDKQKTVLVYHCDVYEEKQHYLLTKTKAVVWNVTNQKNVGISYCKLYIW
jgi:hypothetical protein